MTKSRIGIFTSGSALLFLVLLLTIISGSEFWTNILSPICSTWAAVLLLYTYYRSRQKNRKGTIWIFFALACLSWTVGDLLWIANPTNETLQEFSLTILAYFGTNLFLLVATCFFIFSHNQKWNRVLLVLDATTITLSTVLLVWNVFLGKSAENIDKIVANGFIPTASTLFDFLLIIGLSSWFLSIRSGNIPQFVKTIIMGVLLFSLTDLYYYYLFFFGTYIPDSLIDGIYVVALLLIPTGALLQIYSSHTGILERNPYSNMGIMRKGGYLLIFPLVEIVVAFFIPNPMIGFDIFVFLLILIAYQAMTAYVQSSIENERLLQKETEMNFRLEQRVAEQTETLITLANQDTVTPLYNRRYFIQTFAEAIQNIKPPEILALMLLDVDRFKTINDTYGHDVGDRVLIEMARRMEKWNTFHALLARHGGDEFILTIRGNHTKADIEGFAQGLIDHCSKPMFIDQYELNMTISLGIAIYPDNAHDDTTLIRYADIAMYQAKSLGFNQCVFFDSSLHERVRRKNRIEILLKKALRKSAFKLFYQPQFSLPDAKLLGMEALLRWEDAEQGYISPAEFIPIAEELGLMKEIGASVAREAFEQIAEWNNRYDLELKMGINFSPKQLSEEDFTQTLDNIMKSCSVKPGWVDVEITESTMLDDNEQVNLVFEFFKRRGISVSIDDFGTGYSSLKYLKRYPFSRLKIDKSLIDNIVFDESERQIITAIIAMSNYMDIKTLAEGVGSQEQLDMLIEMGCEQVQGFLLGKPLPADAFEEAFIKATL